MIKDKNAIYCVKWREIKLIECTCPCKFSLNKFNNVLMNTPDNSALCRMFEKASADLFDMI